METTTKGITKPKVHKSKRLVLVWHKSLQMFEVRKITINGEVSKKYEPRVSFKPDVHEACRAMKIPYFGFKSIIKPKEKPTTWNGIFEQAWSIS